MAIERERKFLVNDLTFKALAIGSERLVQGYLSAGGAEGATVRVRVAGPRAWLTVKGPSHGAERDEWEYAVPVADALAMLGLCPLAPVEKTRWLVPAGVEGLCWEVDEYHGALDGLLTAELELPEGAEMPEGPLPSFIGREVTGNPRYYNSSLAAEAASLGRRSQTWRTTEARTS